jgi:hypothetical protein
MPLQPTSWWSILILYSHLVLGLPSGLIRSDFPKRTFMHLSNYHPCYIPRPSQCSWFDYPSNVWWWVQIIKLRIMHSPSVPSYLVPPNPKYLPGPPIFEHPYPMYLPQCERQIFTPLQNNRKKDTSFTLCIKFTPPCMNNKLGIVRTV